MLLCPGAHGTMRGTALLYQQEAEKVLSAWRKVKRDIVATEPGSPEYAALHAEARQLRDEYQLLIDAARLHLRPELPPFPVRLTLSSGSPK